MSVDEEEVDQNYDQEVELPADKPIISHQIFSQLPKTDFQQPQLATRSTTQVKDTASIYAQKKEESADIKESGGLLDEDNEFSVNEKDDDQNFEEEVLDEEVLEYKISD